MEKQSDWANALAWYAAGRFLVGRQDGSMALYAADKATSDGGVASAGESASVMKKPAQKPAKAAAAAKPELLRAWPAGVVTGQAVTVQVEGKALSGVTAVSVSDARLKAVLKKSVSPAQLELELTAAKDLPRGSYSLTVTTAAGTSAALKLYADDLPQLTALPKEPLSAAVNAWGVLKDIGQRDDYRFTAKKGHTVVLDAAVRSITSKAATPQLEVFSSKGARLAFSCVSAVGATK